MKGTMKVKTKAQDKMFYKLYALGYVIRVLLFGNFCQTN